MGRRQGLRVPTGEPGGEEGRCGNCREARAQTFRAGHSRRGDLRQAHRHGPRRHGRDAGEARPDAGRRARRLPVQDQPRHGGPLGADARRQGAGRDGDGADPNSSSTQNDTAQSTTGNRRGPRGRGGSRLLGRACRIDPHAASEVLDGRHGAAHRPDHLLQGPQWAAVLFADAAEHRRRQAVRGRPTPARM